MFETMYYQVESIDGDYANLKRTDVETDEPKLVARALLPAEIQEGTKLVYEMMQYKIVE
ncbi:MAG: chorismate--pyruvate lyase [Lachnospiraceae bacterium]|nr:chorismate--pyruvate lyase [Lachnospiraceae bacterium]